MTGAQRLEGTLGGEAGDFGEVLLDLSDMRATGILKVQARNAQGEVFALKITLIDGQVSQVDSPTRSEERRLGQLLVRGEQLLPEELAAALERARARSKMLGEVLVGQKQLAQSLLEETLKMQFLEDMHQSVSAVEGGWRFKASAVQEKPGSPPPLLLEEIVEHGRVQAEYWPTVRSAVPSLEMTFNKLNAGPISPKDAEAARLGPQELRLFSLVHKSRSVADLMAVSRLESFEVCRSLAMLVHGGFISSPMTAVKPVTLKHEATREGGLKRGLVFHATTMLLVIACLAVSVGVFLNLRHQSDQQDQPEEGMRVAQSQDPWRESLTRAQLRRLEVALEVYRQRRGDYPPRLMVLVEERLLEESDLNYPNYKRSYTYRLDGDNFRLSRPKK